MNRKYIIDKITNNVENKDKDENIIEAIKEAMREWENARAYFEIVSEPMLVDYAIYMEAAAKSRYTYLIREARKKGITVDYRGMAIELSAVQ